ncbi:MAG: OmpA family protein [Deltaproteobacteria bacterium]|nr:OmpA family protein [Deltaproteobacteria bacterium]
MKGILGKKSIYQEGRYQKMIASSIDSVEEDQNWLITLSDLLSLLLVFFIIFFALSRATEKRKEAPLYQKTSNGIPAPLPNSRPNAPMETIRKDMRTTVTGLGLDDEVIIEGGEQEILILLKENVTFHIGEADVLKGSEPILDTIAQIVKRYPTFQVEIDGHTDDQPINTRRFPSNWELSVSRATNVLKYLITCHGLDPARFTIKGNAEQRPLSPNRSPEQRAQNRRVEIRLKDHPAAS